MSAKATKRNTTVTIADTGKGILPENLAKLTDPFTKADSDPYLAEQGWGLGLSITKSLVELHDGTMDIVSKVGKGRPDVALGRAQPCVQRAERRVGIGGLGDVAGGGQLAERLEKAFAAGYDEELRPGGGGVEAGVGGVAVPQHRTSSWAKT